MNKKQLVKLLEQQAAAWHKLYVDSKATDAALVESVIQDMLCAVNNPNTAPVDGQYAGMVACYGSDQLRDHVFHRK